MTGVAEYRPSREPDPVSPSVWSRGAPSTARLTDIHGTAKRATHTDVGLRYLEYGPRAGCKSAPRGQFERKELTNGNEQRTSACSKPASGVGRPERRRRAQAMYPRLRIAGKALRHRDDRQS